MKLATIMIIVQAILLLASLAAFGFMIYSIKTDTNTKTGAQIWASYNVLTYIVVGIHGLSLVVHGLSTFWCRGR